MKIFGLHFKRKYDNFILPLLQKKTGTLNRVPRDIAFHMETQLSSFIRIATIACLFNELITQ
jgi:hypothetical protein